MSAELHHSCARSSSGVGSASAVVHLVNGASPTTSRRLPIHLPYLIDCRAAPSGSIHGRPWWPPQAQCLALALQGFISSRYPPRDLLCELRSSLCIFLHVRTARYTSR